MKVKIFIIVMLKFNEHGGYNVCFMSFRRHYQAFLVTQLHPPFLVSY